MMDVWNLIYYDLFDQIRIPGENKRWRNKVIEKVYGKLCVKISAASTKIHTSGRLRRPGASWASRWAPAAWPPAASPSTSPSVLLPRSASSSSREGSSSTAPGCTCPRAVRGSRMETGEARRPFFFFERRWDVNDVMINGRLNCK